MILAREDYKITATDEFQITKNSLNKMSAQLFALKKNLNELEQFWFEAKRRARSLRAPPHCVSFNEKHNYIYSGEVSKNGMSWNGFGSR